MTEPTDTHFDRLTKLYATGAVPWDHADPPPEVCATVPPLPVGRALDLGCGLGRATQFLARHGWQVDGVDFIPQAIAEATARAQRAGLATHIQFHVASVTQLDFLTGPYDFALDVGCAHRLPLAELRQYHDGLSRLLRPGALYLLFAHLVYAADPASQKWRAETELRTVFAANFALERVEYGQTTVNTDTWHSAWFWFTRTKAAQ